MRSGARIRISPHSRNHWLRIRHRIQPGVQTYVRQQSRPLPDPDAAPRHGRMKEKDCPCDVTGMSPLRQRMIEDMTLRNLSPATQRVYIRAVAKFTRHFRRSPDRLGIDDVRAYLLHLVDQKYSWQHVNQVSSALRFCFGVTLGRTEAVVRIVAAEKTYEASCDSQLRRASALSGSRHEVARSCNAGNRCAP
jgi:hypothetical protein